MMFLDLYIDDGSGSHPLDNSNNIVRKEMGLEWMLRPKDSLERKPAMTSDQPEEPQAEEVCPFHKLIVKPHHSI